MNEKKQKELLAKMYVTRDEFSALMQSDFVTSGEGQGRLQKGGKEYAKYIIVTRDENTFTLYVDCTSG